MNKIYHLDGVGDFKIVEMIDTDLHPCTNCFFDEKGCNNIKFNGKEGSIFMVCLDRQMSYSTDSVSCVFKKVETK